MSRAVLFLGTANAARSILAECILTRLGKGGFQAYSAGSHPSGIVAADTLAHLHKHRYKTAGLRSKTWDEFAGEDAPALDIVITLANSLIGEVCPVFWTGRPATSHWPLPENDALDQVQKILDRRIAALVALPFADLDPIALQMKLDAIGRS